MRFQSYKSPISWRPEKPGTLVVCCADARFHPHVRELVHAHIAREPDILALPGGPASIDPWASSFDHGRVLEGALEVLVEGHDLQAIWLIAHEACSFYARKHGPVGPEALRRRQCGDLLRVRHLLIRRWPLLEVHPVYAAIEDGTVVFHEVVGREDLSTLLS